MQQSFRSLKEIKDLMGEDYKTTLKHTADPNLKQHKYPP